MLSLVGSLILGVPGIWLNSKARWSTVEPIGQLESLVLVTSAPLPCEVSFAERGSMVTRSSVNALHDKLAELHRHCI